MIGIKNNLYIINPLTSPGEVVSVYTSPYLSAGAPALGEAKGLIGDSLFDIFIRLIKSYYYIFHYNYDTIDY